jgi:hypothetical protein
MVQRFRRVGPLVAAALAMLLLLGWTTEGTAHAGCTGISETWWSANGYDTKMAPLSSYFCWLGGIAGNWTGTGQSGGQQGVEVIYERDGYWHLVTYQNADAGIAYCQPASCFYGNSGYSVEWDNRNYPNNFWNASALADTCGSGCNSELRLEQQRVSRYPRHTGRPDDDPRLAP